MKSNASLVALPALSSFLLTLLILHHKVVGPPFSPLVQPLRTIFHLLDDPCWLHLIDLFLAVKFTQCSQIKAVNPGIPRGNILAPS